MHLEVISDLTTHHEGDSDPGELATIPTVNKLDNGCSLVTSQIQGCFEYCWPIKKLATSIIIIIVVVVVVQQQQHLQQQQ